MFRIDYGIFEFFLKEKKYKKDNCSIFYSNDSEEIYFFTDIIPLKFMI